LTVVAAVSNLAPADPVGSVHDVKLDTQLTIRRMNGWRGLKRLETVAIDVDGSKLAPWQPLKSGYIRTRCCDHGSNGNDDYSYDSVQLDFLNSRKPKAY
jgi:hypothetical protein